MDKRDTNYYAVLPATVRYDDRLSIEAKLIYAELVAMSDVQYHCEPKKEDFSRLLAKDGLFSDSTKYLKQLESSEHIMLRIQPDSYIIFLLRA